MSKANKVNCGRGVLPVLWKLTETGPLLWEIWVERTSEGHGRMVTRFGLEDGKKQILKEVISQGKNLGRKNETTPYEQACLEARARWEKQRARKGYGLTVAESAVTRAASPMLAQVYADQRQKVNWDSAFAQPKLDGFRALARWVNGDIVITSRENQPMPALAHIADWLKRTRAFAEDMVLDGEMYCHGMSLNQIASACKRRSALSEKISYHVYDCVSEDAFGHRYKRLRDLSSPAVTLVETVKVRSESDLMICQKTFLDNGYEGAMLRHGSVGYEAGKRSAHLLKVKTFTDAEFEVVDYKLGRGKYENVPIFTCVTAAGHEFDVLAPGNMEEKQQQADRANDMLGKKLTVKYQYMTKTENPVPFLPVAVGFRE